MKTHAKSGYKDIFILISKQIYTGDPSKKNERNVRKNTFFVT
jgi:hypothetical protein